MTFEESRIKSLENHIRVQNDIIEGWNRLVEDKDVIINKYSEMINPKVNTDEK